MNTSKTDFRSLHIDLARCDGCGDCAKACANIRSHLGHSMIYVYKYGGGEGGALTCMHCQSPPCVRVCPTEAIKTVSTGFNIVLSADESLCIGCDNCTTVCPFGIPYSTSRQKVMVKCDLCYAILLKEGLPRCVSACPRKAIRLVKPSELSRDIREEVAARTLASIDRDLYGE